MNTRSEKNGRCPAMAGKPVFKKTALILAVLAVLCLCAAGCGKSSSFTGTVDFSPYGTLAETEEAVLIELDETAAPETEPARVTEYGITFELTQRVMYATSNLNVRTEPNTTCSVAGMLSSGQAIQVTGLGDGWVRITYNDETCYVSADYVSD